MPSDTLVINIVGSKFKDASGNFQEAFTIPSGTTKVQFHSQGQAKLWLESGDFLVGGAAHSAIDVSGDTVLDVKSGLSAGAVCNFDVGPNDPFETKKREIHPCMIIGDD